MTTHGAFGSRMTAIHLRGSVRHLPPAIGTMTLRAVCNTDRAAT